MTQMKERTLVSFDWAMKHILRDKANFDVLEGFLSALLNENIQVAREKLNLLKMSEEERRAYERFWLARASYQDEIQSAEKKGHDKGLEEGREEGVKKGKEETARKMRAKGLDPVLIAEISGLTEAELLAL